MPLHYGQFNLEYIAIITTSLFRKGSIGKVYQVPHQMSLIKWQYIPPIRTEQNLRKITTILNGINWILKHRMN